MREIPLHCIAKTVQSHVIQTERRQKVHLHTQLLGVFHGSLRTARLFCGKLANAEKAFEMRSVGKRRV